jgi:hypothetical protein
MSQKIYLKRSNVVGKIPTALDLGEIGANTADGKLYMSSTTSNKIIEIGWNRIAKTGDTMTGQLIAPSFYVSGGTGLLKVDGTIDNTGYYPASNPNGYINNIKTIEGQSLIGSGNIDLTKTDVGLSNVDNTADINKWYIIRWYIKYNYY